MGRLRRCRGHGMPQGPAWSGMAGLRRCTMPGSWSGQPQVWLKRTRVQTCRAWGAVGAGRLARRMGQTAHGRMMSKRHGLAGASWKPRPSLAARVDVGNGPTPRSREERRARPGAFACGIEIHESSMGAATSPHNTLSRCYFPRRRAGKTMPFRGFVPDFTRFHVESFLICSNSAT